MGRFDVTARRTAKRDPVGFFRWTLARLDPALSFAGWLDSRTAPQPPVVELTCDALAEFATAGRPEKPWIIVTEFQTEPKENDLERVAEYAFRFRQEHRPSLDQRLKYRVGALILNLTGPRQPDQLVMPLPGMTEFGLGGRIVRVALREEDAAATLARVASGELSRCVLPWVSLMRGGGEPVIIEEWKRLADLEPDRQVRLQYAMAARIFAELPDVRKQWVQALEGWNVQESQEVLEWQAEAVVKTQRANILHILETLCGSVVPADVASGVQSSTDPEQLARWFDAALKARSYEQFREAMAP